MIATDLFAGGNALASDIANHLWQSTLFAAAAWLLTIILRKNRARVRYWIWAAVSVKFLVPFSLLMSLGGSIHAEWIQSAGMNAPESAQEWAVVQYFNQPFSPSENVASPVWNGNTRSPRFGYMAIACFLIWGGGSMGFLLNWLNLNRRASKIIRESFQIADDKVAAAVLRLSQRVTIPRAFRIAFSMTSWEPGVYGVFRPVLVLPSRIHELLSVSELEPILQHELSHIRNRDNLVAAVHTLVKTLFWFHPLVWWIGAKLIHERECACDEAVLQSGNEPQSYAEGILKVCEFYLESPLPCVSGVIGSNLKKRIERIMTRHIGHKLSGAKMMFLTAMAFIALTVPLLIGIATAPSVRAQSQGSPKPAFEVESIKPTDDCRHIIQQSPGKFMAFISGPSFQPGRFSGCSSLKGLISTAYQIDKDEISGGPGWSDSANYQIEAKAEGEADKEVLRLMLQSLLEKRFGLKLHHETLEKPVYALVVAEGGHKLKQARDENGNPIVSLPPPETVQSNLEEAMRKGLPPPAGPGNILVKMKMDATGSMMQEFTANSTTMQKLADALKNMVGRKVLDKTGLNGLYDIQLQAAVDRRLGGAGFMQLVPSGAAAPPGETGSAPSADPSGPSVFTALQEQLGLKLVADKAPLEHIIIDSAEKPPEN